MAKSFNGRSKSPWIRLVIGIVIVLGAVGFVLYHGRWVRSAFQGPVPVTLASLQEVKDPKSLSNPWISLSFNEAIDTGLVMESTNSGTTTVRSKYLLIQVGDRWLITDVPAGFTGNQVIGYLDKWWSPLSNKVIDQIRGRFPGRDILPYQLNAEYSYKGQCLALLGIAGFIFLVGLAIAGFACSDLRKMYGRTTRTPRFRRDR